MTGLGLRTLLMVALLTAGTTAVTSAQERPAQASSAGAATGAAQPLRRLDVSLGGGFLQGVALGSSDARLRANATSARPYTLFASSTLQGSAPTIDVQVGTWLSRRIGAEASFSYGRPEIATSVSGDVEGAAELAIVERIDQYLVEGRVLVSLDETGRRPLHPFVAAGVGYLRQLHEGLITIEHGHVYHLAGGIRHHWRSRPAGFLRRTGVRAEAGVKILSGGVTVTRDTRVQAVATGAFVLGF